MSSEDERITLLKEQNELLKQQLICLQGIMTKVDNIDLLLEAIKTNEERTLTEVTNLEAESEPSTTTPKLIQHEDVKSSASSSRPKRTSARPSSKKSTSKGSKYAISSLRLFQHDEESISILQKFASSPMKYDSMFSIEELSVLMSCVEVLKDNHILPNEYNIATADLSVWDSLIININGAIDRKTFGNPSYRIV